MPGSGTTPLPVDVIEAEKLAELGPEQVRPSLLAQAPCALKLPLNAVASNPPPVTTPVKSMTRSSSQRNPDPPAMQSIGVVPTLLSIESTVNVKPPVEKMVKGVAAVEKSLATAGPAAKMPVGEPARAAALTSIEVSEPTIDEDPAPGVLSRKPLKDKDPFTNAACADAARSRPDASTPNFFTL